MKRFTEFGKFVLYSLFITIVSSQLSAAQKAWVITDGALVYKDANFDAPVLGYLQSNKKVLVSNRKTNGFFKIKLKKGIVGFVSDADIKPLGKTITKNSASADSSMDQIKKNRKKRRKKPPLAKSFGGMSFSYFMYADSKVLDKDGSGEQKYTSSGATNFLGIKYTSPITLVKAPYIWDHSLRFTLGTPDLYRDLSFSNPDTFILAYDSTLIYSLKWDRKKKRQLYFGAGLSIVYTDFKFFEVVSAIPVMSNSTETRIGLVVLAGYLFDMSSYVIKAEPRLYLDKENYVGIDLSIQMRL